MFGRFLGLDAGLLPFFTKKLQKNMPAMRALFFQARRRHFKDLLYLSFRIAPLKRRKH